MTKKDLASDVANAIRRNNLFHAGDTVVMALSGGADSCALLDILTRMKDPAPKLVVAHLNHCLRGADSDADEAFSRNLAAGYGVPFESLRQDVAADASSLGMNLEDAGRQARIAFLTGISRKYGATAIALAHHGDDQAETFLMRLLRGSGMTGLSGMGYRNQLGFIRPMLGNSRAEIEAYLQQNGLGFREDKSNSDTTFLRNRIRHELLPLLTSYNPAVKERLTRTAGLLSEENDLLEKQAQGLTETICTTDGRSFSCQISQLIQQPAAMRRRIYRSILIRLTGSTRHFTRRHIDAIEQLLSSEHPNATIRLPQQIAATREYEKLLVNRHPLQAAAEIVLTSIPAAGDYELGNDTRLRIETLKSHADLAKDSKNRIYIDLDKAPFPWLIRSFRPGDRISPKGMNGSKKIKDILIDEKIPLPLRRTIPLLFSGDTLIWACGIRSSQSVTAAADSTRIASLEYIPAATNSAKS